MKELNINSDTLNLLEEKVGNNLIHIGKGDNFLNRIPIAQLQRSTISIWDLKKLKSFLKAKDTVNKRTWQPIAFINPTSNRGLISKIYKELKKQDINKPNNPVEK